MCLLTVSAIYFNIYPLKIFPPGFRIPTGDALSFEENYFRRGGGTPKTFKIHSIKVIQNCKPFNTSLLPPSPSMKLNSYKF